MGSATTPSTVSTATMPTSMTDAEATRLGLKVYVHGGSYVSALAPTISVANLSAVNHAAFIPYQMQDGSWRLKFNISISLSVGTTSLAATVAGVVFRTVTAGLQVCTGVGYSGTSISTASAVAPATLNNNTASSSTGWGWAGDIELASKPTWAY